MRYDYSPDTSSPLLSHNLAKLTDASGRVYVDNTYDADDRVVSQIYGTGTISYAYTLGNIHADDTPSGVGSGETIGYYVASNLGTNRRGMEVEHVYDRHGNMTSRIVHDPTGPSHPRVTLYAYDAEHRLTSEARPLDGGTTYAYDAR